MVTVALHNWLALYRTPGVGPAKFHQCLANDPELLHLPAWVSPDWQAVEHDLTWQQQTDCHILTLYHEKYPSLLKEIVHPPPLLFVQGDVDILNKNQLAIVGSRNPSSRGASIAHDFAKHLSSIGILVTSGLAIGIDAASHNGALSVSNGKTIAVLASGLDQIYPRTNKKLAANIIANGALVTEFPLGVRPIAHNFPRRNRIISGLSLGVLVVEAAVKSGALITAEFANEQGREVFAIPNTIDSPTAKGCHQLIKQGAKLVESAADILDELGIKLRNQELKPCAITKNKDTICAAAPLHAECLEILPFVDGYVTAVDEIIIRSKQPTQDVISKLLQLELYGHVLAVPGGYVRTLEYSS